MVRRHRILEMFIHDVLDVPWNKVHDEAEHLEHAVSDSLVNRMEKYLGFPKFDPHGAPIPSETGEVPTIDGAMLLSEAEPGHCFEVVRVSDGSGDFLNYLDSINLVLKSTLSIDSIHDFDQSMLVKIGNVKHTISAFTSQHVWVIKEEK